MEPSPLAHSHSLTDPRRAPDADLDGLSLKRTYPRASNYGSLLLPGPAPPSGPARDASGKVGCRETRFKHELILNGSVKNSAWFRTTPKSEPIPTVTDEKTTKVTKLPKKTTFHTFV